jgi:hypothetical protein
MGPPFSKRESENERNECSASAHETKNVEDHCRMKADAENKNNGNRMANACQPANQQGY